MVLKNSQLFDMFLKSRKTATESLEMQILGGFLQFLASLGCEKNKSENSELARPRRFIWHPISLCRASNFPNPLSYKEAQPTVQGII